MFTQFTNPQYWLGLLYSIPGLLLALSIHEYAHAWAAYKCGDPTARNLGRMTLDPLKQLDVVGTICLLLFRFGWAKPVPINPRNFKHPKRDDILVSLAGIIANFILSFITYGIYYAIVVLARWQNDIFINIMQPIIMLNITLGIFNLLPIPPLDGFQVVSAIWPRQTAKFGQVVGRYGFIILFFLLMSGLLSGVLNGFTNWLLSVYASFWGLFGR